jgi:hypothetical protein
VDTGSANTQSSAQDNSKAAPVISPTPAKTGGLGSAPSLGPGAGPRATAPANQPPAPSSTAVSNADHYRIVRMLQKKDSRVLGNVNVAIYGKVSQKENWIKTVSQPVSGNWIKLTPAEPLQPGEYAVVELLDKGQVNLFVWDFGVNPSAAANANAWSAKKSVTGQSDEKPGLEKRPPH